MFITIQRSNRISWLTVISNAVQLVIDSARGVNLVSQFRAVWGKGRRASFSHSKKRKECDRSAVLTATPQGPGRSPNEPSILCFWGCCGVAHPGQLLQLSMVEVDAEQGEFCFG